MIPKKKKLLNAAATSVAFLSFLSYPKANEIKRAEISAHLDARISEFRSFYKTELNWIENVLNPLAAAIGESHRLLKLQKAEVDSWGGIEEIKAKRPIEIKIRAERMLQEAEDSFIWLFLADLNLRRTSDKHLEYLKEIYTYVGSVGALFSEVQIHLSLILQTYEEASAAGQINNAVDRGFEALAKIEASRAPIYQRMFENETLRVEHFLNKAHEFKSRLFWLEALASCQSLIKNQKLSRINPAKLWVLFHTVNSQEVKINEAKENLRTRLQRLHLDDSLSARELSRFFDRFMTDPIPDRLRFQEAESLLNAAERRFEKKTGHVRGSDTREPRLCRKNRTSSGRYILCAATKSSGDSNREGGRSETRSEKSGMRVYNTRDESSGHAVETVHVTTFHTDASGKTSTSSTSVPGDSAEAAAIRDAFGIEKDATHFDASRTYTNTTPNESHGEISFRDGIEVLPSPTPSERVETKVSTKTHDNTVDTQVSVGEPIAPDHYKGDAGRLYSNSSIDRADMHNGSTSFSSKVSKLDSELKNKSDSVAFEIRTGEFALQTAFQGVLKGLRNEVKADAVQMPESVGAQTSTTDPAKIRSSIKTTRHVLSLLRNKLNLGAHPEKAKVEQGFEAVESLLDASETALNSNDVAVAAMLLTEALSILADYGPMALRIGLEFTPAGPVADLVELLTGKDAITHENIGKTGRLFAAAGLFIGTRQMWEKSARFLHGEAKVAMDAAELHLEQAAKEATKLKSSGKSVAVLGQFPEYLSLSKEVNARFYSLPTELYRSLTAQERWWANEKFIDRQIARGSEIILSTKVDLKTISATFKKEYEYLLEKGFSLTEDGLRMIRK